MAEKLATAYPRKHFFLEMFTRDISLEDCILDLVDNSIDGLIRSREIDVPSTILSENGKAGNGHGKLPVIKVDYSVDEFSIEDTCGGISRKHALEEVFNFGHAEGDEGGTLGVYGIGLKRAIFKIGDHFQMESRTAKEGFSVDLRVRQWASKDKTLEDWKIPLTFISGAGSEATAGTTITIKDLRKEVVSRMNDGTLAQKLHSTIAQAYGLFLGRYVDILLNGHRIEPFRIPIGRSGQVEPAHEEFEQDGVKVRLFASLAARNESNEWPAEPAGWYALCNGRVVVAADKTELTGWGVRGSALWHAGKYRGFVGAAFFQSSDPLSLPWTTTKRGLNRESSIYQLARNKMMTVAKPILSFLDGMYKGQETEESSGRQIAEAIKATTLAAEAAKVPSTFHVTYPRQTVRRTSVRVQYDAELAEIERVKKHLKKYSWSASRIGRFTFDHYLKTECPE